MWNKDEPQFTPRRCVAQPSGTFCCGIALVLGLFQLGVALDEFFCAAAGKAHGNTTVFVVAFDADDGSDAVAWMAHSSAEHGIRVATAFCGRAAEGRGACSAPGRGCRLLGSANATKKFLG